MPVPTALSTKTRTGFLSWNMYLSTQSTPESLGRYLRPLNIYCKIKYKQPVERTQLNMY